MTSHTLVGRYSHMFLAMFHFYFFFFSLMSLWIFSSLSCKLIESRSHGGAHCTAAIDQLAKIVSGWKPLTCRTYLSRKKKSRSLAVSWSMLHFLHFSTYASIVGLDVTSVITSPGEYLPSFNVLLFSKGSIQSAILTLSLIVSLLPKSNPVPCTVIKAESRLLARSQSTVCIRSAPHTDQ